MASSSGCGAGCRIFRFSLNLGVKTQGGGVIMGMDAVGMAMGMQTAALQQKVATSVFKMGLDAAKEQGQALTDMMDDVARAAQPHLGSNLDITA